MERNYWLSYLDVPEILCFPDPSFIALQYIFNGRERLKRTTDFKIIWESLIQIRKVNCQFYIIFYAYRRY